MASCDDFSLLGDDNHHQPQPNPNHHHLSTTHHLHQSYAPQRCNSKSAPIHPTPQPTSPEKLAAASAGAEVHESGDEYGDCAFQDVNPFSGDENSNPFNANGSDPNKPRVDVRSEKRKSQEELSDGGTQYTYKKKASGSGGSAGGGEYRKDREEWSDAAIACLLDAYTDKFMQLNRGNLRGRDWEEVAATISERCDQQTKSVEQCKNKVDNLKKRYKLERHRMNNGGVSPCHWPWFQKLEEIIGNSLPSKAAIEEDKSLVPTTSTRQSKRYSPATPSLAGPVTNLKPKPVSSPKWRRVVFKISGAALSGNGPNNIDPKVVMLIAREVAVACQVGIEVAIVVGGRNVFCGDSWVTTTGLERSSAYQTGMMATMVNALLLQSTLEKIGVQARVQSSFPMKEVAEPYNKQKAIRHLEKGRVVIFGGVGVGAGNPFFSTDSAAALRASEIRAGALVKGTNVDGVYDCTSQDNNVIFEHISFRELASSGAASMDVMALGLCEENAIPVVIFNVLNPGNVSRALCGDQVGTLIDQAGRIS